MVRAARRPVALVVAGFLAGCAVVLSWNAATDTSPGQVTPLTKQQQFEQFKSQFTSK